MAAIQGQSRSHLLHHGLHGLRVHARRQPNDGSRGRCRGRGVERRTYVAFARAQKPPGATSSPTLRAASTNTVMFCYKPLEQNNEKITCIAAKYISARCIA
eukprot:6214824-Pleurochrysis_carterae.AAC.3